MLKYNYYFTNGAHKKTFHLKEPEDYMVKIGSSFHGIFMAPLMDVLQQVHIASTATKVRAVNRCIKAANFS